MTIPVGVHSVDTPALKESALSPISGSPPLDE
jgi:hypothetical protein